MKKRIIHFLFVLAFLFASSFSSAALAESKKTIDMNFANFYRASHLVSKVFEKWAKEVEKRTEGRVHFTFYHGSSLAKMPETYDMVKTGSAEIGSWLPTYQAAIFPVSSAVNIPFTFDGPRNGGTGAWEFYRTSPEMQKEYSQVKLLMLFTSDIKNIHTRDKSIHRLEQLNGLRIGCGAGLDVEVLKLLGATPVQTRSLSDQYLALQRGTSDGIYYPWAILKSMKMMDLLKYHAVGNIGVLPVAVAMNLKQWNSLPKDIQKVFEELSLSASALCGLTLEEYGNSIKSELKASGNEIYLLPATEKARWIEAVKPVVAKWKETVAAKNMNPDQILNALTKAAAKYRETPYPRDPWWDN